MKNLLIENKNQIYISILVAIVVILFLEPFIKILGDIFLSLGSLLFQIHLDNLYKEIAAGQMDYSFSIFMILILAPIFFAIYAIRSIYDLTKKEKNLLQEKKVLNQEEKSRRTRIKISIVGALLIFISLFILTNELVKVETNRLFQQKIKILKPYTEEKEIDMIISEFSSMESQKEFTTLTAKLDSIAKLNRISLPEN